MQYLPLQFSGILQYYASNDATTLSRTYSTNYVPTRAAVVGLIASALGYGREELDKIKELYKILDIKYKTVRPGEVISDFQTVRPLKSQNNYMNVQKPRNVFIQVDGKPKDDDAILKKVEYLQDAEFVVYLGSEEKELRTIFEALKNPQYALYFGKRSCVPNKPIATTFDLISEDELENVFDCA